MKKIISILLCAFIAAASMSVTAFAEEKVKVACVGDSITEGWASTDLSTQSYPAHLQNLLGDGYDVQNFGIGGRTAMKVAEGMTPYWNESFFTNSKNFEPDIVILMLGTNDVVTGNWNDGETYYPDLKALVETYQNLSSQPKVYLATPPHAYDTDHPDKLQNKAVPIVKQVAQETGATLVDINAMTEGMNQYYPDAIHPNDEGYYRLALMFYENVFDGVVSDLTVVTDPGNEVYMGELTAAADESGKAVLKAVDGVNTFTVKKPGGGFITAQAEVKGNTTADCTAVTIPENLAASATASDKAGTVTAVNDADASTGWQSSDGDYSDLWLSYDLGEAKDIHSADIEWEEGTRGKRGKYTLEYSSDGSSWTSVTGASYLYSGTYDAVTFDSVNARYLRIKISDGTSSKDRPKIFEMGIFKSGDAVSPVVTYGEGSVSSEVSQPQDDGKGGDIVTYIVISVAVIAVAGIAAAMTVNKQKKNGNGQNTIN